MNKRSIKYVERNNDQEDGAWETFDLDLSINKCFNSIGVQKFENSRIEFKFITNIINQNGDHDSEIDMSPLYISNFFIYFRFIIMSIRRLVTYFQ